MCMTKMYNDEITLIKRTFTSDELGNQIPDETESKILCDVKDIGTAEFYQAANQKLKPTLKAKIHAFEYNGEDKARYKGALYNIMRTYVGDTVDRSDNALSGEEMELTLSEVIGDG